MLHGKQKSLSPVEITKNLKNIGHFRLGRQEDSHEFIINLLDKLEYSIINKLKDQYDRLSLSTNPVNKIFGGAVRSQLRSESGFESNTFDPFVDISLNISNSNSLEKALKAYIHPDRLDGDNQWKNPKTDKLENATKTVNIHACPYELMIHLQRFTFTGKKISKFVHFDHRINLGPYTTEKLDVFYNLHGIVVHSGSTRNSGHYYCYVKSPNGNWYEMDDDDVKQVSLKTVSEQNAYLLFYTKEVTEVTLPSFQVNKSLAIDVPKQEKPNGLLSPKPKSSPVKEMPPPSKKSEKKTSTPIAMEKIKTPSKSAPSTPVSEKDPYDQPLTPLDESGGVILTRKRKFDAVQRMLHSKQSLYSEPTDFFSPRDQKKSILPQKRQIDHFEYEMDRGRNKKKKYKPTLEEFKKEDNLFKQAAKSKSKRK